MAWFIVQSLIMLVLSFALGIAVGWLIWARRRPADAGTSAELATAKKQLAAAKEQLAEPKEQLAAAKKQLATAQDQLAETKEQLGTADDQLAVAKERLAAAEERLATCTCDTSAGSVADPQVDDADLDSPSEDLDAVATDQEAEAEETIATEEAEETDDIKVEADEDSDVAALAVAVGALSTTADDSDDIERIDGIGPKIGRALRAAGLGTYAAIADASQDALREAIEAGGVTFAPSIETWSNQARLLADGDEAGFMDLTDRLVGGRIKG